MVGAILAARRIDDLFHVSGSNDKAFRRLLRYVHPDVNSDPRASDAFDKLQKLWDSRNNAPKRAKTLTSRLHEYTLEDVAFKTDVATVYNATWDAGHAEGWLKITRSPSNADLARAEVVALKKLREAPDDFKMYHPDLLDAFRHRDPSTGKERSVVVTDKLEGFYTLREVKEAYPHGLDGRDAAWMLRRLFVAMGTAHDLELVHGSVTLNTVMIHPGMHGLVLTDWSKSVKFHEKLKATDADYYKWVRSTDKDDATHRHDIRFAAKTMLKLVPSKHTQLRAFLNGCTVSTVPTAAELLAEFDELLERLYGKRSFHPFTMPPRKDT